MTDGCATDSDAPLTYVSGILNLAKPRGMTSHDAVDLIRRATGTRRVGHAGTLDPQAAGVLLVCLGNATRLSDYLMNRTKRYRATIRFGATSTTDDLEGIIARAASIDHVTEELIRNVASTFVGELEQVPPAFSAIKVAGRPLYKRARAGEPVVPAARRVRIESVDVLQWKSPDLLIDVVCSKGTYIRSLARDLGAAVQSGAYLLSLVRTASGRFSLTESVPLREVERAARLGYLENLLYPLDQATSDWPVILLAPSEVSRIRNGLIWSGTEGAPGEFARGIDQVSGKLVALLTYRESEKGWQPSKVFVEGAPE